MSPVKTSNQLSADWGLATTTQDRRATEAKCDAQADQPDFGICLITAVVTKLLMSVWASHLLPLQM